MNPNEIISINEVEDQSFIEIKDKTEQTVHKLGDPKEIFENYDKVLIKPNFVLSRSSMSGSTSNIFIIETLIKLLLSIGKEPIIIENGGLGYDVSNNPLIIGVKKKICTKYGIEFIDPLRDKLIKVPVENGITYKYLKIPKIVLENGLINVPKLKTHEITTLTGAIKNLLGLLPKEERYFAHIKGLHGALYDIYKTIIPQINIMDAITIMDGNGPALGNPIDLKLIIGSNDTLFLDVVACRILSINPKRVKHLSIALKNHNKKNVYLSQTVPESTKIEIQQPTRSKFYLSIMDIFFAFNYYLYFPLFKTDMLPIRDKVIRQSPEITNCESCEICTAFCPFDAIDKDAETINHSYCKLCHWCLASETCKKKRINERKIIYIKGFLDFLGPKFRKFPNFDMMKYDINQNSLELCPTNAVSINGSKINLNKKNCIKCPTCFILLSCKKAENKEATYYEKI